MRHKHLAHYIDACSAYHNARECDTIAQMASVTKNKADKHLHYKSLVTS